MKKFVLLFILLVKVISGYSQNDSIVAEMVGDYDVEIMRYFYNRPYESIEEEDLNIIVKPGNDSVDFFVQLKIKYNPKLILIPFKITLINESIVHFAVNNTVKIIEGDDYDIYSKNVKNKYKQVNYVPFFNRDKKQIKFSIDYVGYVKDTPTGELYEEGTFDILGTKK